MNVAVMDVRPVAWEWWAQQSGMGADAVALHGTIVALLVVGWALEPAPVNAPSVLKTRLITLPAQPQVAPAAQPLAVEAPPVPS